MVLQEAKNNEAINPIKKCPSGKLYKVITELYLC